MAGRAALNRSHMGETERAGVMPALATAVKLAQALEVPPSQLIAWCEEQTDLFAPAAALPAMQAACPGTNRDASRRLIPPAKTPKLAFRFS